MSRGRFTRMVESPDQQARQWAFICYCDDPSSILSSIGSDRGFCTLHDRDTYDTDGKHHVLLDDGSMIEVDHAAGELKKAHWHVYAHFPGGIRARTIADSVGLVFTQLPDPRQIKNAQTVLRYHMHLDDPDKAEYSRDDVKVYGEWKQDLFVDRADLSRIQALKIWQQIFDQCSVGDYSIGSLTSWCITSGCWSEYKSAASTWKDMLRELREERYHIKCAQQQYEDQERMKANLEESAEEVGHNALVPVNI